MGWLIDFASEADKTDRFKSNEFHKEYLTSGLFGEAGSLISEFKKAEREQEAYARFEARLKEEIGDFLWYFARIIQITKPELFHRLESKKAIPDGTDTRLSLTLQFGIVTGDIVKASIEGNIEGLEKKVEEIWDLLNKIASLNIISLEKVAEENKSKINSRWPKVPIYHDLFDENFIEEEQLPRRLTIEFKEIAKKPKPIVLLKSNGLIVGDRLSDNIQNPDGDGYRFHDIFHFSYAVFLGWSPVTRALLKCKRKSNSKIDEGEDGARAIIIEEAISATIFSYSKELNYFQNIKSIEYSLLKIIKTFSADYEVSAVPLWQWEKAILEGFSIFRMLKQNGGGTITLDLLERNLSYTAA